MQDGSTGAGEEGSDVGWGCAPQAEVRIFEAGEGEDQDMEQ